MRTMTMASLLLLSTVCAIPASASYFFNSYWGTMLNVGSAPNPTPEQLRAIGDSRWARAPQGNQGRSRSASVVPTTAPAPLMASVAPIPVSIAITSPTVIIVPRFSPKEEKRITAELNKASLMRATMIASKVPAAGNKKTASKSATPVKAANAKGKPVKAAATTNGEKKPRV